MSIEILTFTLGAVLLLTGILGGGFEVKDLKIPTVGPVVRVAATICGSALIALGFWKGNVPPLLSPSTTVTFTIVDRLGDEQISEQVDVRINGELKGQLTVNEDYPTAMLTITVPRAGTYTYSISALARYEADDVEYAGRGQGALEVAAGKRFELEGGPVGDTLLISLVDVSHQQVEHAAESRVVR